MDVKEVSNDLDMVEAVRDLSVEDFIRLITIIYSQGYLDVYNEQLKWETPNEQKAYVVGLVKSWLEI